MKHQLVRVTWDDAEDPGPSGKWLDEGEVTAFSEEVCLVVSVGYVVSHTKKYLTISGDYIEKLGHYGRVTKIPSAMVQKIDQLEVAG